MSKRGVFIEIVCGICKKSFKVAQSRYYQKGVKYHYCSTECYDIFKIKRKEEKLKNKLHKCSNCGKTFNANRKNKSEFIFCSQKCSIEFQRGENAFSFKGGTKTVQGYKAIKKDGKYHLEHRLIIEEHFNIKLKKNEVVHHKDENKLNNDISNLQIMTKKEHDSLHSKKRHLEDKVFGKFNGKKGGELSA